MNQINFDALIYVPEPVDEVEVPQEQDVQPGL